MNQVTLQTVLKSIASVRHTLSELEKLVGLQMQQPQQQVGYPGVLQPAYPGLPQQQIHPSQQNYPPAGLQVQQHQAHTQQIDPRFAAQYAVAQPPQPQPHPAESSYLSDAEDQRLALAMGLDAHPGEYQPAQNDPRADALRMQFGQQQAQTHGAQPQGGVASYLRSGGIYGQ